jgi:cytochrome c-type biogenesis protein CcmF
MVRSYEVERDVTMAVGDTVEVAGHAIRFRGFAYPRGPNYQAVQAIMDLARDGRRIAELRPEKRVYRVQRDPMTEAAIHRRLGGDVYVSLGEPVGGGVWTVRIHVKPFVSWIWGGCALMAMGGALALGDRRYRVKKEPQVVRMTEAAA